MIQPLERRLLLANVYITEGRLRIESTDVGEKVEMALLHKTQAEVYVDGVSVLTFELKDVRLLSFSGAGGDDTLIVGRVPLPVYAEGGDGRDAISCSQGEFDDTFFGQAGGDYCWAGPGDDSLDGGPGYDGLFGFTGDDYFVINSDAFGDDTVTGGDGTDLVDATRYPNPLVLLIGSRRPGSLNTDDFIFEDVEKVLGSRFGDNIAVVSGRPTFVHLGNGNDTFTGGSGDDTVIGGRGSDELFGSSGNDILNAADGEVDAVVGSSGNDIALVDSIDTVQTVEDIRTAG